MQLVRALKSLTQMETTGPRAFRLVGSLEIGYLVVAGKLLALEASLSLAFKPGRAYSGTTISDASSRPA